MPEPRKPIVYEPVYKTALVAMFPGIHDPMVDEWATDFNPGLMRPIRVPVPRLPFDWRALQFLQEENFRRYFYV